MEHQNCNDINNVEIQECTGCGACAAICPKKAIHMAFSREGFLYPVREIDKCVSCMKCTKVCPIKKYPDTSEYTICYAAINKDFQLREQSSSGGVFSIFAQWILKKGGIVYGAAFDEENSVVFQAVDRIEDLCKIRGSKYVQSYAGTCFPQIKLNLENHRLVLFSGLPCQIAGLKNYLGQEYHNLYTIDVICHGAPSPLVWKKYLECLSPRIDISDINFRDKRKGWRNYSFSYYDRKNRKHYKRLPIYMNAMIHDLINRKSCGCCTSRGIERCSDLTLGDFWGIEKIPELRGLDDDRGSSIVLVHSFKGSKLFEMVSEQMKWKETSKELIEQLNPCLVHSPPYHKKREEFFEHINSSSNIIKLMRKSLRNRYFIKRRGK